jgi:hypothetical protein
MAIDAADTSVGLDLDKVDVWYITGAVLSRIPFVKDQ